MPLNEQRMNFNSTIERIVFKFLTVRMDQHVSDAAKKRNLSDWTRYFIHVLHEIASSDERRDDDAETDA